MFWLRNKKNNFQLRTLIWGSGKLYRESYKITHVLLNLLNELGKSDKMQDMLFHNEFNKFNNTGAQMLDSICHMTLKLRNFCVKTSIFAIFYARL